MLSSELVIFFQVHKHQSFYALLYIVDAVMNGMSEVYVADPASACYDLFFRCCLFSCMFIFVDHVGDI